MQTKHLSIMFTDMKGFTTKAATTSREQLHHLLELQDELIKPAIKHFDGTIVKTIGDAFMVTFESPTDAVLCGMKIQENILNHNARAASADQMEVRIAINSGEVNMKDSDVFGEPVNIASRIESIAEPNEVYFTEAVYLSMNKNEIPTAEVGYRRLKGVPEQIKVFKVVTEQTNLIRAKIKREQMAMANSNLAKDEVNAPEDFKTGTPPAIEKDLIKLEKSGAQEITSQMQPKKSFWKKHKKKFLIAFIIFLVLMIISLANEKKKAQEQLIETKYPISQIQQKLPVLEQEVNQVINSQNQENIRLLFDRLKTIAQNISPSLKPQFEAFLNKLLQNQNLKPAQRTELKNILNSLK